MAKFVVSCCAFANFTQGLAGKNKTENDARLLMNSEGNRDDEWNFC